MLEEAWADGGRWREKDGVRDYVKKTTLETDLRGICTCRYRGVDVMTFGNVDIVFTRSTVTEMYKCT